MTSTPSIHVWVLTVVTVHGGVITSLHKKQATARTEMSRLIDIFDMDGDECRCTIRRQKVKE